MWKPEACGQIVLPDRSLLIGQKLVENAKIKKIGCKVIIFGPINLVSRLEAVGFLLARRCSFLYFQSLSIGSHWPRRPGGKDWWGRKLPRNFCVSFLPRYVPWPPALIIVKAKKRCRSLIRTRLPVLGLTIRRKMAEPASPTLFN